MAGFVCLSTCTVFIQPVACPADEGNLLIGGYWLHILGYLNIFGTHSVDQAGLKFTEIRLPLPPEC